MATPINFILPSLSFTITSLIKADIEQYSPTDFEEPLINLAADINASILNNLFCYVDNSGETEISDISKISFGVVPPSNSVCPNDDASFNNVITSLITGLINSAYNSNAVDASFGSIYIPVNTTTVFPEDFLRYTYVYSLSNSPIGTPLFGGVDLTSSLTTPPVGIYNAEAFQSSLGSSADSALAYLLWSFNQEGFRTYSQDTAGNSTGNSPASTPTSSILRAIFTYDKDRLQSAGPVIQNADASGNVTIALGTGSYIGNIGIGKSLYPNLILPGDTLNFTMTVQSNSTQLYENSATSSTVIPPRIYKIILTAK